MDLHARLLVLVLGYHSGNQRDRDRLLRVEVIVRRGRDRFPDWQWYLRTVLMKKVDTTSNDKEYGPTSPPNGD